MNSHPNSITRYDNIVKLLADLHPTKHRTVIMVLCELLMEETDPSIMIYEGVYLRKSVIDACFVKDNKVPCIRNIHNAAREAYPTNSISLIGAKRFIEAYWGM